MLECEISKTNCFNVWFDETNISWTRLIDNKLCTYRASYVEEGLLETMSSISSMDDKTFKLLCKLNNDILDTNEGNLIK